MVYRCILPNWAATKFPNLKKVVEGELSDEEIKRLNSLGYSIYFLPNFPSAYIPDTTVDGSHIDSFNFVFVDFDLKAGKYESKECFMQYLRQFTELLPTFIVDSGNGVHAYWQVDDLDAMSFLRLQRRLMRKFDTDDAVAKIYQLMRVPGTINTKHEAAQKSCEYLFKGEKIYTCEDLDKSLPAITLADEAYCKQHFDKTYGNREDIKVSDKLPQKFYKLVRENKEVNDIYSGKTSDRSKSDYRLGHIMLAAGFTKAEAMSVMVNCAKALDRAPVHRVSYASGIVDKIFEFEPQDEGLNLSSTVGEILSKQGEGLKGTRFSCYRYLDATHHGFRLGQVIGLVAGSGVGKTAMALNMFRGFVQNNPEYDHFFVPLEQPTNEIADRWKTMCGDNTALHEKVHVISNYAEDGSFRHLSFTDIKDYLLKFKELTGKKIGCVVIDHIGALKKTGKDGENQDLMDICHEMKAFAIGTKTLLVMQSQTNRDKAGIGDLELDKDAAYGTMYFEAYCDYLITIWQPLKRCYSDPECPTITSYKFCKIRHKNKQKDEIQEDVCYRLFFEPETETLRELTQIDEKKFEFWAGKALTARKKDKKTELVPYKSTDWTKGDENGAVNHSKDSRTTQGTREIH